MKAEGLSGVIQQTSEQMQRVGICHKPVATLIACWIAGTYAKVVFEDYGYLFIQSSSSADERARALLHLIGELNWEDPVPMVGIPQRTTRVSWGSVGKSKRIKSGGRPVVFTGTADLRSPMAERCFHVVMTPRRPGKLTIPHDVPDPQQQIIRTRFDGYVNESYRQIEDLYRHPPRECEALDSFDTSFRGIAIPLLVMAVQADRSSVNSLPIVPELLEGFHAAAPCRDAVKAEAA